MTANFGGIVAFFSATMLTKSTLENLVVQLLDQRIK